VRRLLIKSILLSLLAVPLWGIAASAQEIPFKVTSWRQAIGLLVAAYGPPKDKTKMYGDRGYSDWGNEPTTDNPFWMVRVVTKSAFGATFYVNAYTGDVREYLSCEVITSARLLQRQEKIKQSFKSSERPHYAALHALRPYCFEDDL